MPLPIPCANYDPGIPPGRPSLDVARWQVRLNMCQNPALTTPCCLTGNVELVLRGKLVITLPAYSRAASSHTSGVLTCRLLSHFRHTHTPLVVTLPAYSGTARSHTTGVLTRRSSSRGIHHAPRGLVAVLSHVLHGLVVHAVSVTPGVVLLRSSHTALGGLVVRAVFVTPGVVSSRSSDMPCVGWLFSQHPPHLAWSRHDLLTCLCVEKNLQTSYCALPLYLSFPLWNHSLPARLTQFLPSSS